MSYIEGDAAGAWASVGLLTASKQDNIFNANVEEGQAIKYGVYLNKIDEKDNTQTVETTGNVIKFGVDKEYIYIYIYTREADKWNDTQWVKRSRLVVGR